MSIPECYRMVHLSCKFGWQYWFFDRSIELALGLGLILLGYSAIMLLSIYTFGSFKDIEEIVQKLFGNVQELFSKKEETKSDIRKISMGLKESLGEDVFAIEAGYILFFTSDKIIAALNSSLASLTTGEIEQISPESILMADERNFVIPYSDVLKVEMRKPGEIKSIHNQCCHRHSKIRILRHWRETQETTV